jgi:hypothetical protein
MKRRQEGQEVRRKKKTCCNPRSEKKRGERSAGKRYIS